MYVQKQKQKQTNKQTINKLSDKYCVKEAFAGILCEAFLLLAAWGENKIINNNNHANKKWIMKKFSRRHL